MKACVPVGWQVESGCLAVDVPAKNAFEGGPLCIPFCHLLYRSRLSAVRMVLGIEWAEDVINGVQSCAQDAFALPGRLGHEQKIVDIYIDSCDR